MPPSEKAALRGEPSYVWRSGQERRLQMIAQYTHLENARVLDAGSGVGMYTSKFIERYTPHVAGLEYEHERAVEALECTPQTVVGANEHLPYPDNTFDTILSHETIEHVTDDRAAVREMLRVLVSGGRLAIFCPNRWFPFETHGHYWRGEYHFGNTPLINYLPDPLRNRLAPHVRTYTRRGLLRLLDGLPARVVHYRRIYGGGDSLARRYGRPGRIVADLMQAVEGTPFDAFGLSHFLVVEKTV
jgi:SAM-dependent methyltransferase